MSAELTTDTSKSAKSYAKARAHFRFCKPKVHLTYPSHIDHAALINKFTGLGGGYKWYSVVHETGKDGDYNHTHFACEWNRRVDTSNPRFFDFEDQHPNIKYIISQVHSLNIWEYHKKDGHPTQSPTGPSDTRSMLEQVISADTLAEAIDIAGVEIKSVSDIVHIRAHRDPPPKFEHIYDPTSFNLNYDRQSIRSLFVYGPSGTGKTMWACHQFDSPLVVSHLDTLRHFNCHRHDGIVFDDMSFAHLPRETGIYLLDWEMDRDIHIRHVTARIPKHTRKIFTSNKDFFSTFPADFDSEGKPIGALLRRVNILRVIFPCFTKKRQAQEEIQPDPEEQASTRLEHELGRNESILLQSADMAMAETAEGIRTTNLGSTPVPNESPIRQRNPLLRHGIGFGNGSLEPQTTSVLGYRVDDIIEDFPPGLNLMDENYDWLDTILDDFDLDN